MRSSVRGFAALLMLTYGLVAWANPPQVYVNATWTGPDHCGGHTWHVDAFASIQDGVTAVADQGTVSVAPGLYTEQLTITRSVMLLGPQRGVDPNAPTPADPLAANPARTQAAQEAIIVPSSNALTFTDGTLINVLANNVVIDGFTLDGDNPVITGGVALNGADANTLTAIGNRQQPANVSGLLISHNILRNFVRHAIHFEDAPTATERMHGTNAVLYNRVENCSRHLSKACYQLDDAMDGTGVYTYKQLFIVRQNTMLNVDHGIDLHFCWHETPGFSVEVTQNRIHALTNGIQVVLMVDAALREDAASALVDRNWVHITPTGDQVETRSGIAIADIEHDARVLVTNNEMSGGDAGIFFWELPTYLSGGVTIRGGSIRDVTYGVIFRNVSDYGEPGGPGSSATITDLTVLAPQQAGLLLVDDMRGMGTVTLHVRNLTVQGGPVGAILRGGRTTLEGDLRLVDTPQSVRLEGNGSTEPISPEITIN